MAEKEIKVDLFDPANKDNQRFINLLDDSKWKKLASDYASGMGKPFDEALEELLESR
jgi:hypothetical protein